MSNGFEQDAFKRLPDAPVDISSGVRRPPPKVDIVALDLAEVRVPERIKQVIQYGHPEFEPDFYDGDRTLARFAVVTAMLQAGHEDGEIAGVLTNPAFAISSRTNGDDVTDEFAIAEVARARKKAPPQVDAAADFADEPIDPAWFQGDEPPKPGSLPPLMRLNDVTKANVNLMFKFVNLSGKPRILYWGKSPLDPTVRVPQFWTPDAFKDQLCNKFFYRKDGEDTKRVPVASWWLSNPKRKTFDGVTLVAEEHSDSPDSINLWRGFGFEPNQTGDWSLMRDHIRDVIASGVPARDEYIIRWIAWALQNPTDPCEVALILKSSAHGTGKGVLLRAIRKLFGAHGMQISKSGLLTGRFNSHLAMTCFLFVDEMTLANNEESAALNSTLTEDVLAIEPKGIDSYMMPNHLKVAAASNQDHVVLVAGSDRRFQVFNVSPSRARDIPYFKAIQTQLDNGGYGRMLHDLLEMDLGDWHPRQLIPDDKAPEQVASAPPEDQWLAGYLDSGFLDCQVSNRAGVMVHATPFFQHARKVTRGLAGWSDNRFADYLKRWKVKRRRSGSSQWEFPPLADMRAAWVKQFPWWPPFDKDVTEWREEDDLLYDFDN